MPCWLYFCYCRRCCSSSSYCCHGRWAGNAQHRVWGTSSRRQNQTLATTTAIAAALDSFIKEPPGRSDMNGDNYTARPIVVLMMISQTDRSSCSSSLLLSIDYYREDDECDSGGGGDSSRTRSGTIIADHHRFFSFQCSCVQRRGCRQEARHAYIQTHRTGQPRKRRLR